VFRIPTPPKLLHGLPSLPHLPSFQFGGYGPIPGFSSHGIGLGLHNLGVAFSPHGLYQGLGPHGAGGELAAPFIGGGGRIASGRPPTVTQLAGIASLFPSRVAGARAMVGPYNQTTPTPPRPPSAPPHSAYLLALQQRAALLRALQALSARRV